MEISELHGGRTKKRKLLLSIDAQQPKIDEIFGVVRRLDDAVVASSTVSAEVAKVARSFLSEVGKYPEKSTFFADLYETYKKNHARSKTGRRYSADLKRFSTYIFVIGGRLLYETLSKNMPMPSISTVLRVLKCEFPPISEGSLRTAELKQFLQSRGLPLEVWLSEDGTRITGKVQYDPATNEMVGIVLPLDPKTGLPRQSMYAVNTAHDIAQHFASGKIANYAYVIMARPVAANASAFCLCMFGTDNRFKAEDVLHR